MKFTRVRGSGIEFSFQRDFGVDLDSMSVVTSPRSSDLELFHGGRVAIDQRRLPRGVRPVDVFHRLFEAGISTLLSMVPDRAALIGELDREAALVYRRLLGISVVKVGPTLHCSGAQTFPGVMTNAALRRYLCRRRGRKAVAALLEAPAPLRRSA